MNEIAKLYFQYTNGADDSILLETETLAEMKEKISHELEKRDAKFTGVESIQESTN